ncbi:MAG TPA: hypothetical protein V6C76_18140 [Drouetiella sp.]
METDVHDRVRKSFEVIFEKPCWSVQQGHGSFLTFEFGEPYLDVWEQKPDRSINSKKFRKRKITIKGEWHLWIYCCHWNLTLDGDLLAHSESSRGDIKNALEHIDGEKLVRVSVNPQAGESEFEFELGGKLKTVPYERTSHRDEYDESWMFFEPDGNVLVYRGDGKYRWHSSSRSSEPTEQIWL